MTDEELREIFEQSKTRTQTNLEKLRAQMRIRTDQPRFSGAGQTVRPVG
jgi:hypothetical protein